jgi:aldose 1-epimerase
VAGEQTARSRLPVAPSGEQFELVLGEQRATIVEVGGGIRRYSVGEREVLEPYDREAMCDGAHGAPLIPWPNRLAGGRYEFDGHELGLALTEPTRANAIHGLLRWRSWRAVERKPERVVMGIRLHPLPGYPFALEVRITYLLADDGLSVATKATNIGARTCPYGTGQHPYLAPGNGALIDTCTLTVAAETRLTTDPERMLPNGSEPVQRTRFDFRQARSIGGEPIDSAYTDLDRDEHGLAGAALGCPDGRTVELRLDENYDYLQIYTGDTLAAERRRRGLGVEPMTCPADAFNSGEHLLRLEPGGSFSARWGVRLL